MFAAVVATWTKVLLALRLASLVPTLPFAAAYTDASAAVEAATPAVPADVLVSIAFIESRFDPTATSRIEGNHRRTGSYPSSEPPRHVRGPLYCGELQTAAETWPQCLALRERSAGYAAGARELTRWLRDRRVHGDLALALAGHGCGNAGVSSRRCNGYPSRVFAVRRQLARTRPMSHAPSDLARRGPAS